MVVKYSVNLDKAQRAHAALSRGNDLKVHFKNTYETGNAIRGMSVARAQAFLAHVLAHKEIVPFRKHNGGVGRHAQVKGLHCPNGRWPTKSVVFIQKLLQNAIANAKAKGLNVERMFVSHVAVQQARPSRRRLYRAHGRINSFCSSPCHIELILAEKQKQVAAPAAGKATKRAAQKMVAREAQE